MRSFGILIFVLSVCATESRAESPSDEVRVDRLVDGLDDDLFQVREAAQQELVRIGEAALVAVGNATTSESPEVRFRARTILRQILGAGLVLYLPMERHPRNAKKHVDVKTAQDRDGKIEAEKRSSKVTQTSLGEYGKDDIYIGALWNDRYNFRGTIDEVRIYNRALSQKEINALMMITE